MFSAKPIAKFERKLAGLDSLLVKIASELEQDAKSRANWLDRTGNARRNLHAGLEHRKGDRVLYLAHGVWYGHFLELGTSAHDITPRRKAKKKAVYGSGLDHPIRVAHHPGISPRNVLHATFDANLKKIGDRIVRYWRSPS